MDRLAESLADEGRESAVNAILELTDLVSDPSKVSLVPSEAIPALRGKLAELDTLLLGRLLSGGNGKAKTQGDGDHLLGAKQTAARLGMSLDYVYKNASEFPFAVKQGRRLLFSESGLERYLQDKLDKKYFDI